MDVLKDLVGPVNTTITSPPYWRLRDYGHPQQLGQEKTPEEYIENLCLIFDQVHRITEPDGTLWVNIGDTYWNKQLTGVPWALAKALGGPRYKGLIKAERDRVWLAATVDAEGCICGFYHERPEHSETHRDVRTGLNITITNTSEALLAEANRIWPASHRTHQSPGEGHLGKLTSYRWIAHSVDKNTMLMRELYPYLIVKKKQALLAYNLLLFMEDAKHLGKTPEKFEIWEKRKLLVETISKLNKRQPADIPSWCVEPPALVEPGWILRSDVIWHKLGGVPETCKDRPSRNHEYLFLFAKNRKYFYDYTAVLEPHTNPWAIDCIKKAQESGQTERPRSNPFSKEERRAKGTKGITRAEYGVLMNPLGKNKRTVWSVKPAHDKRNHFATFPEDLIKPCIIACCPLGGYVLDPFCGTATTGKVSLANGRNFIGIELVEASADMAEETLGNVSLEVDKPAAVCEPAENKGKMPIEQFKLPL